MSISKDLFLPKFTFFGSKGRTNLGLDLDKFSVPVWEADINGKIIRANQAYIDLSPKLPQSEAEHADVFSLPLAEKNAAQPETVTLPNSDQTYQLHPPKSGVEGFYLATPLERPSIDLEGVIKNLQVGLMFFDKFNHLILFNPALQNLTGLSSTFLNSGPSLGVIFDRFHDRRLIPEPRDYKHWRKRQLERMTPGFTNVIEEDWDLTCGRTFRFTVASYGDKGISIQLKDVTSEISINRNFRASLSLAQTVLDKQPQAIAVIDNNGRLSFTNEAYKQLWGHDPESEVSTFSSSEILGFWASQSQPTSFWDTLADYIKSSKSQAEIFGKLHLQDERELLVSATTIDGGGVLITFRSRAERVLGNIASTG